jgi:hypothetical protein
MTMFDWMLLVIAIIATIGASVTFWRTHHRKQ